MNNVKIQLAIDEEIAEDFRESFSSHYNIISHCVMELDNNHDSTEFLDEIFRSLHSIKGNSNMCQLNELTDISHALEDAMMPMREGTFHFTSVLGEIILLTLDKIKGISEDLFEDKPIDSQQIEKILSQLLKIQHASAKDIPVLANQYVNLVAGHVINDNSLSIIDNKADNATFESPEQNAAVNIASTNELKESLNYFCHLAGMLDNKLPYRKGRLQRILPLAQMINDSTEKPVDPVQLEGAVYMHDFAFAFLSESLVMTDKKFTAEEAATIQTHPRLAADFMRQIPGWEEAAKMVWQHHEWWNGNGYPKGIREEDICTGARILAIVDAYESMTHPRPDRQYKRSILRAITEINNFSGKQFSPEITRVFNDIVRKLLAKRK